MAIDFTDFGLLGNSNGVSIAKKISNTTDKTITTISEDLSGSILQKTYDINSVFSPSVKLNNGSEISDTSETVSDIVENNVYNDYDLESEQAAYTQGIADSNIVSEPIIDVVSDNNTVPTDAEMNNAVIESEINDQFDANNTTSASDEEMNNAVVEAEIRDQYDADNSSDNTPVSDEEMNNAVIEAEMRDQYDAHNDDSEKVDDNNDRMDASLNADVMAQFEPNPEKKEPTTEDVKDAIRKDGISADTISDYRVKLSSPIGKEDDIYGSKMETNILKLLHDTNGILFHYTPTITEVHNLEYKSLSMVSSNQDYFSYTNTSAPTINVSGSFVVKNVLDAKYCMAVIHFIRTISKSHFGKKDLAKAGSPPPILELSGYGRYMYNRVPVIVRSHTLTFADDIDFVDVYDFFGNKTQIPMEFTITLDLVVQNTPRRWREEFNLDSFRTGELMRKQTGWL